MNHVARVIRGWEGGLALSFIFYGTANAATPKSPWLYPKKGIKKRGSILGYTPASGDQSKEECGKTGAPKFWCEMGRPWLRRCPENDAQLRGPICVERYIFGNLFILQYLNMFHARFWGTPSFGVCFEYGYSRRFERGRANVRVLMGIYAKYCRIKMHPKIHESKSHQDHIMPHHAWKMQICNI
jgi:hypothetical protein